MKFFALKEQGLAALLVVFTACNHWGGLSPEAQKGSGVKIPVKISAVHIAGGAQNETITRAGGASRMVGEPIGQDLGGEMLAEISVEEDVTALRDDSDPQPLADKVKFRVIAIDAATKKLYSYADYTVLSAAPQNGEISPDAGELHVLDDTSHSYDFICISYNSTTLPDDDDYEEGEELPLLSANVSKDIFYWRQEVQTVGSNFDLSIVLRPQFVKVKLKLDAGENKTITAINGSISLDASTSGDFNLATGSFSGSGNITFSGWMPSELGVKEVTSSTITFLPKATDYTLTIQASALTLGGSTLPTANLTISLDKFNFVAGGSYTLSITFKVVSTSNKFAGSNIYWDGSALTFYPHGENDYTKYQGVYFKWGSLIGVSPVGDFSSGTTANDGKDDGTPIYMKNPDGAWVKTNVAYATNQGWFGSGPVSNATDEAAWSPIPSGSTAGPYGTGAYTLLTLHLDFAGYRGDICNCINPAYRMPTSDELANLTYDSYSTSNSSTAVPSGDDNAAGKYVFADASYGAFTTTNPDGSYVLPASGYRGSSDGALSNVGYRGRYWSGSAYDGNDVYYLLFDSNSSAGASLNFRSSGRSVRCVLQE